MFPNLVNLCLDAIVDNFRRYNLLFNTTKDENMKLKFKFLQKRYSSELLKRLCVEDDLPEEFTDLLINKYLEVLDTSWLKNCSWEKITSKIAEIGCNVEKIFFQDVYLEEFCGETPWQDIICHLPNLKSFTFPNECHDLILQNVAKFCPNIEEINIENSPVTFEAVKRLCKNEDGKALCTKLKNLSIAGTPIEDNDVKYLLKNLPSLETIDYPNLPLVLYSLHKNDLFLDKMEHSISTLDLMNLAQTDIFVDVLKVCLSACPHLKNLTCGLVNEDDIKLLSNLSHLEQLHIESFSYSEININNLLKSNGGKLTYLRIGKCTVSISVLCENCPRIEELILSRVHFLFDDDVDDRPVFNSLSSLTFEISDVETSERATSLLLSSSENLESLSFEKCDLLSCEIKTDILKCCELYPIKKISFRRSVIEKEYVEDLLFICSTLRYLNIDSCFDNDDKNEILELAGFLANNPEIDIGDGEHSDISQHFDIGGYSNIGSSFYISCVNNNFYITSADD